MTCVPRRVRPRRSGSALAQHSLRPRSIADRMSDEACPCARRVRTRPADAVRDGVLLTGTMIDVDPRDPDPSKIREMEIGACAYPVVYALCCVENERVRATLHFCDCRMRLYLSFQFTKLIKKNRLTATYCFINYWFLALNT